MGCMPLNGYTVAATASATPSFCSNHSSCSSILLGRRYKSTVLKSKPLNKYGGA